MINIPRVIGKSGKRLLIVCVIAFMIACSATILSSSHASAATKPHASKAISPKGLQSPFSTTTVGPAWNFNGCGTGWSDAVDTNFQFFKYSYTTGNQACTSAVWNDSVHTRGHICNIEVYIPTLFATANITYGIVDANGIERQTVNQNNFSGWISLSWLPPPFTSRYSSIDHVFISSNNGETGTAMAAGQMRFICS